jgi:hypothetical protein
MPETVGVTWGEARGPGSPPQYFFTLRIVFFLVTELNNGKKYKRENEKLAFYGAGFALFKI